MELSIINVLLLTVGIGFACFMGVIIFMLRDDIFKSTREDYVKKLIHCKRYENGFLEVTEESLHNPKTCKFCIEYGKWKAIELKKEQAIVDRYAIDEINSRLNSNEVIDSYGWDMMNRIQTRARQLSDERGFRYRF